MGIISKARRGVEIVQSRCYLDLGGSSNALVLAGVARSGTTWLGGVLQDALSYRSVFEPLFPAYVRSSRQIGYFPYRNRESEDPDLYAFMDKVLKGELRGKWVDRDNSPNIYRGRVVKEIRCNLILSWLTAQWPEIPIILLVRNPLDVYKSWVKLGWLEDASVLKTALSNFYLPLDDNFQANYPDFVQAFKQTDLSEETFDTFFMHWLVSNLIPLVELRDKPFFVASYEEISKDTSKLEELFSFVNSSVDRNLIERLASRRSSTDFSLENNRIIRGVDSELFQIDFSLSEKLLQELGFPAMNSFLDNPLLSLKQAACLYPRNK